MKLIGTLLNFILSLLDDDFNICGASLFTIPKFHKKSTNDRGSAFRFWHNSVFFLPRNKYLFVEIVDVRSIFVYNYSILL